MLVLSRRKDETIMIGDDVEITVVDVRGDTVRLGIQAPRHVSVHRKEIYNAIQAENIAALNESMPDQSLVGGLGQLLKSDQKGAAAQGLAKLSGAISPGPPKRPSPPAGENPQYKKPSIRKKRP